MINKLFNSICFSARSAKPKILLLVDKPNWAFDISARNIAYLLREKYDFEIKYVWQKPKLNAKKYDILYVFFWGETYHHQFNFPPKKTIKGVSSFRWQDPGLYGPITAEELVEKHLSDASAIASTSIQMQKLLTPFHPNVWHTPNGFDKNKFFQNRAKKTNSQLIAGWAGNIDDPIKGVNDILIPSCEGLITLNLAPGNVAHEEMNLFYNKIDLFFVSSQHEGEPLTLIEAMATGCFPVCTDVGIVSELITHERNGLIISRDEVSFKNAIKWCISHPKLIHDMKSYNSNIMIKQRQWPSVIEHFDTLFQHTLNRV